MNTIAKTGINGLDAILSGGIPRGNAVIVEGAPGTGKTTLAIEFLFQGAVHFQEPGIYFTFEEHPEQIYRDMMAFGFDLRALEARGLLRIVSISPETYCEQLLQKEGLVQHLIEEIGCKRIVLDSISLFRYGRDPESHRALVNRLRNHLRRYELTSLLLLEAGSDHAAGTPFEHFLFDGLIRMKMQEQLEQYRLHTIEITKMRGSRVLHGEHIYRFAPTGIHVIPSYSTVSNQTSVKERVTTGIPSLDEILSGGLLNSGNYLLQTDSHSNSLPLMLSIISERVKANDSILLIPSGTYSLFDLLEIYRPWGVNWDQLSAEGRLLVIDQYNGAIPSGFRNGVYQVSEWSNQDYLDFLLTKIAPIIKQSTETGNHWFIFYDLNALIGKRGEEWMMSIFPAIIAIVKELGATLLCFCNTDELSGKMKNTVERTSSGIIKIWSNGQHQFLQVTKSSDGITSPPLVMERTETPPYVRIW